MFSFTTIKISKKLISTCTSNCLFEEKGRIDGLSGTDFGYRFIPVITCILVHFSQSKLQLLSMLDLNTGKPRILSDRVRSCRADSVQMSFKVILFYFSLVNMKLRLRTFSTKLSAVNSNEKKKNYKRTSTCVMSTIRLTFQLIWSSRLNFVLNFFYVFFFNFWKKLPLYEQQKWARFKSCCGENNNRNNKRGRLIIKITLALWRASDV